MFFVPKTVMTVDDAIDKYIMTFIYLIIPFMALFISLVRDFTHFIAFLENLFGGNTLWLMKFMNENDIAKSIYSAPWGPFMYYDFFSVSGAYIY